MSTILRALGYIWSSPTVLLCLIFFLLPMWLFRQVFPARWKDGAWEWEVNPGCLWDRTYGSNWAATTLGFAIFFSPGWSQNPRVSVHERRHVWQSLCMGPLYLPIYLILCIPFGYTNNPMEVDARNHS